MSDSSQVRQWGASQEPPLAKADTRGRLSKAVVEAFNAAHPDDPYAPAKTPARPAEPVVTPAPTAGTTEDALRPEGAFTDPPEAGDAVTGEVVTQYDDPTPDSEGVPVRYALPSDDESAPREFATERFEDTP